MREKFIKKSFIVNNGLINIQNAKATNLHRSLPHGSEGGDMAEPYDTALARELL
jgi:hypothetical protein